LGVVVPRVAEGDGLAPVLDGRLRTAPPGAVAVTRPTVIVLAMSSDQPEMDGLGQDAEFVDDAIDDDETSPEEQLLLDRKELSEAGLTLDNPEGFADD